MAESDIGGPYDEYQAHAILGVAADVQKREAVIVFKREDSEVSDLILHLPIGAVAVLVTELHAACAKADSETHGWPAAFQTLPLHGAKAANRIMGLPAVVLEMAGFSLPVVVQSDEAIFQIVDAFQRALGSPDIGDAAKIS